MAKAFSPEPLALKVSTYNTKSATWGIKEFKNKIERRDWLEARIKLPGECKFDERVSIFYAQATAFGKDEVYTEYVEGTFDYNSYWEAQKELCYTGVLVDDEFYITGDHYFYLNFLKIPDKVKNDLAFPRFQDLDVWTYQCVELAILSDKMLAIVKARQTGFSLKFVARMIKRLWFEKAFSGKIAAYEEKYVESAWMEILTPYRNHLNEHTGWPRLFHPADKIFNWKQGFKTDTVSGRAIYKGNLSTLKGVTTAAKASAVVSGKTDEVLYDEAGLSENIKKVLQLLEPALKYGNLITGYATILGAAGEMKQAESLKDIIYNPKAYRCLEFPNLYGNNPDERVGMFVPYFYSYGNCIDAHGNSLIEEAKKQYAVEAESKLLLGFTDYAIFKAQYPATLEEAFTSQEENPFPVELIQRQHDKLMKDYRPTIVTLYDDPSKATGISHKFGSESPVVVNFPVKKDDDIRGALVVDEFPEESPPFGLYYVIVDPIRMVQTSTSRSLHSVTVYKAAHKIDNEFSEDKPVAWYCGRHADVNKTFEITRKIIKRWNARAAIESDQASCLEWMQAKKMHRHLMKRSDMPILKDLVINSQIHEEYGFRTGSGNSKIKDHFNELIVNYCTEVIKTVFHKETGEATEIYGVERIKDIMVLKELLSFKKGSGNYDRIITLGAALMVVRSNTDRGVMVVKRDPAMHPAVKQQSYSGNSLSQGRNRMPSPFAKRPGKPKLKMGNPLKR